VHPPADALPRLQHHDAPARVGQHPGARDACHARTDDDRVESLHALSMKCPDPPTRQGRRSPPCAFDQPRSLFPDYGSTASGDIATAPRPAVVQVHRA